MAGIVGRRDLNLIFSIRQSGAPLGVLVTGIVLPPLVVALGWQAALALLAAVGAAVALATLPLARGFDAALPRTQSAGHGVWAPAREVIATPSLRRLVATSFLFSAMLATLNAFVPTVVSALGGLDLARAGLCAAAAQAGAICGRLLWGVVADRVLRPNATLTLIGLLMAGAALALGSIGTDTAFAVVLAISAWLGATAGGWGGVVMAQAAKLAPPGGVGRIASGVMVFNYLGVMLGPPVVGIVLALSASFFAALAAVACVAALGALLSLIPLAERPSR
jgi:predicted MFS family arabinose efflux permease